MSYHDIGTGVYFYAAALVANRYWFKGCPAWIQLFGMTTGALIVHAVIYIWK